MVQHERELIFRAFVELSLEQAQQEAEEDREQQVAKLVQQEQQIAFNWRQNMPHVTKQATNGLLIALVACAVTTVGVTFAALDGQLLVCIHQSAILGSNLAIIGLCLVGMKVPVLDSHGAPFPWPVPVVDWRCISYALQDGTASSRTARFTLAAAVYGVLVAACGANSLWYDPLTDKSVAPWIVLCGMIVWATTLTLPLLLATVLKLGACFGHVPGVSISLVLHAILAVTAAVFGVIETNSEQHCALRESVIWVVFSCCLVNLCLLAMLLATSHVVSGWHCFDQLFTFLAASFGWLTDSAAGIFALVVLLTSDCGEGDAHLTVLVVFEAGLFFVACCTTCYFIFHVHSVRR